MRREMRDSNTVFKRRLSSSSDLLGVGSEQSTLLEDANHHHHSHCSEPDSRMEDGFKKVMTKEEKRKRKKVEKHRPQFHFDMSGFKTGRKIGIAHIRDLSLYIVADAPKPNWIFAENHSHISHTVLLLVPGITPEHLGIPPISPISCIPFPVSPTSYVASSNPNQPVSSSRLPSMARFFTYGVPTRAPGDQRRMYSVLATLVNSPQPDDVRKRKESEAKRLTSLAKTNQLSPFDFLLSLDQMLLNDYRLPAYMNGIAPKLEFDWQEESSFSSISREEDGTAGPMSSSCTNDAPACSISQIGDMESGWVETPKGTKLPSQSPSKVLAVDCEMVLTETGQELARISVVDFETGANIYDRYVRPASRVVDYRTKWSGITAERLAQATCSLSSVQHDLLLSDMPIINPDTILLGHSLECDLSALRLKHPHCIDTAIIFQHPRGPPYKPALKWLCQKWLDREIQASQEGHDSEEDARACIDLLRLKLVHGPDFGLIQDNSEPIFDRIARHSRSDTASTGLRSQRSAVCDTTNARAGYASRATTVVKCDSDRAVIDAMLQQVKTHDFVFARLMDLASAQGWNGTARQSSLDHLRTPECSNSSLPAAAGLSPIEVALTNLDHQLSELHASLPSNTALILLTGHSSPLTMKRLSEKRHTWERLVKSLGGVDGISKAHRWMVEDDRALEAAVVEAREGMAFFCVK